MRGTVSVNSLRATTATAATPRYAQRERVRSGHLCAADQALQITKTALLSKPDDFVTHLLEALQVIHKSAAAGAAAAGDPLATPACPRSLTFLRLSRSYTALLMRDSSAADTRPGSSETYSKASATKIKPQDHTNTSDIAHMKAGHAHRTQPTHNKKGGSIIASGWQRCAEATQSTSCARRTSGAQQNSGLFL